MKIIEELLGLVSSKIQEIKTITSIVQLESQLAAKSIGPVIFSLFMVFIILISFWLSALTFLAYSAFLIFDNFIYSLLLVLLLNAVFLYGVIKYIKFNVNNMSFENTRKYFLRKENDNVREKRLNCTPQGTRKKITSPRM